CSPVELSTRWLAITLVKDPYRRGSPKGQPARTIGTAVSVTTHPNLDIPRTRRDRVSQPDTSFQCLHLSRVQQVDAQVTDAAGAIGVSVIERVADWDTAPGASTDTASSGADGSFIGRRTPRQCSARNSRMAVLTSAGRSR